MMEITYVKHEVPNWPLGRYYVYQVMCQLFVASYEKFDTKSLDVDIENFQYDNESNLQIAANRDIESVKPGLLDFSEKNPFGNL